MINIIIAAKLLLKIPVKAVRLQNAWGLQVEISEGVNLVAAVVGANKQRQDDLTDQCDEEQIRKSEGSVGRLWPFQLLRFTRDGCIRDSWWGHQRVKKRY